MPDTKREYLKTAIALLLFVAFLALLGAVRDFRHDFEESRNDTRCILHELSDHRHNNYQADVRQAEAVGANLDDLPAPPDLPSTEEWANVCEAILDHDPRG